jgi:hypothetical protein
MKHAALQLFGLALTDHELEQGSERVEIQAGRNVDFKEYILKDATGAPLLRFAKAYGFRNIQNLVRKLKMKTGRASSRRNTESSTSSDYHFVEVMACPSGCINGGGQLKPESGNVTWSVSDTVSMNAVTKEWVHLSEATYQNSNNKESPLENQAAALISRYTFSLSSSLPLMCLVNGLETWIHPKQDRFYTLNTTPSKRKTSMPSWSNGKRVNETLFSK